MTINHKTIRWGILGCGRIAGKFCASASALDGVEVVAVASNSPGKAAAFAHEKGIARSVSSYKELVEDSEIDAVYVANTHNFHCEATLLALRARKAVLCEKPLAINARQTREMVACARENGVFLMEAMWTRFLPAIVQLRHCLEDGLIGPIQKIEATFGVPISDNPRIADPKLAGGALLDLGIYPLSFVSMLMGGQKPEQVRSNCELLGTGVDASSEIHFRYADKVVAHMACSCTKELANSAEIIGTLGRIHLPPAFHAAQQFTLHKNGEVVTHDFPDVGEDSFKYEIMEVNRCLKADSLESPVMPLDETIQLAEMMDALRDEWGVRYPGE